MDRVIDSKLSIALLALAAIPLAVTSAMGDELAHGPDAKCIHQVLQSETAVPQTPEELESAVCAARKARMSAPDARRMQEMVLKRPPVTQLETLAKIYDKNCGLAIKAAAPAAFAYSGLSLLRSFDVHNPATENSSNFLIGLSWMFMMDQCIKSGAPSRRRAILAATLGANVAGNIYFEVEMGQVDPVTSRKVKTDTHDLTAGALATLTYFAVSSLIERSVRMKLDQVCP